MAVFLSQAAPVIGCLGDIAYWMGSPKYTNLAFYWHSAIQIQASSIISFPGTGGLIFLLTLGLPQVNS